MNELANRIPIYVPQIGTAEEELVRKAVQSTWISSKGEYLKQFEEGFSSFVGAKEATTVSNGTVAVHLCLLACGIGPGDEVIVPAFTYVASVNPILQVGAAPVFVDSLEEDVHVDLDAIEAAITVQTKAVMAVHLYGGACKIEDLRILCDKYGLLLIEDAAEGFGTLVNGQHVGTFGDASSFSFFGNKTITTGEGGMVLARDPARLQKMRHLKNQGVSSTQEYWHDELAYNYRMTNLAAAIGVAQLERAPEILEAKRTLAKRYEELCSGLKIRFLSGTEGVQSSYWLTTGFVKDKAMRDKVRAHLASQNIETRPTFPVVCDFPHVGSPVACPNARRYADTGINLPSFPDLNEEDQERVVQALSDVL